MKIYKIRYWDAEGRGTTLIGSPESLDVEQAANLLQENLQENGIDTTPVQVEVFREVTNPLDLLVANIQRVTGG